MNNDGLAFFQVQSVIDTLERRQARNRNGSGHAGDQAAWEYARRRSRVPQRIRRKKPPFPISHS